jgi:hypothetical protein
MMEYTHDIDERWNYVCSNKTESELEVRLSAMRPVKGKIPTEYREAGDKYYEAWAKYHKAWAKYNKAGAKYHKAAKKYYEARARFNEARARCNEAWDKYYEAQVKRDEAWARCRPEIDAMRLIECPDVPWDGESLIFP